MNTRGYLVILSFCVIFSARFTVAINSIELHKLQTSIDSWQDKLQEIKQIMQTINEKVDSKFETRINAVENSLQNTIKDKLQKIEHAIKTSLQQTMEVTVKEIEQASKERHISLQNSLIRLEKDDEERLEKVSSKHETNMQTMENSLKQTIESSKGIQKNLLAKLEKEIIERIGKVDSKFETKMNAIENVLQNALKDNLQTVEQTIKTSLQQTIEHSMKEIEQASKERHINLQDMLIKLEKNDKKRLEKVSSKHETSMQAMENSLNQGLEKIEIKTRDGLENLKNQLNFNMSHIRQHHLAQIKLYQETSDTELKKIDEKKKALDTLSDSIRNISTVSEKSKKILEAHFSNPVRSCRDVMNLSGRYIIHVGQNLQRFEVVCEQTKFEGGWTVIQQRFDGSVDFYRGWTEYRNGFGSLDGEFWLGLEYVYQITRNRPQELLVEVKDFHGNYGYAKYSEFEIGSESEQFKIKKLGAYSGTAGNALQRQSNRKFSTSDRDNDEWSSGMCAKDHHGAWWYENCADSNLNGRYQNTTDDMSAMEWYQLKNDWRGMSYSRMMIRDET